MKAVNVDDVLRILHKYGKYIFVTDEKRYSSMVDEIANLKALEQEPKTGYCKDCKYFEYDSVAKVDGIPLIVAHEICSKWGDGCKTKEDGYCFLFEPKEKDKNERVSDTLTVTFDSSLYDLAEICISRVANGKTVILKAEVGEQADILYHLLTEQTAKAEIKEDVFK